MRFNRREWIRGAAGLAGLHLLSPDTASAAESASGLKYGPSEEFTFEALVERARKAATRPYVAPVKPAPEIVKKIDYDAHGKIRFKPDRALYAEGPGAYPVTFFHLGNFFQSSVRMFEIRREAEGRTKAREILYSPDYFDMPVDSVARKLPKSSGFAGFRFNEARGRADWKTQDWLAFLGASYFRAIGSLGQYGLSARGIAVNTTAPVPEEFPDFTEFYVQGSPSDTEPSTVFAYLDGPSVSGAYKFACRRGSGVVMDVEAAVFVRRTVPQLGIAPLTSMFWFSEYDKTFRIDWRPEVHDSDGLALWTGSGERVFRPLNDPTRTVTSSFVDNSPKGFGLLQRDRVFDHYLDGVNYDRRPSLWVEPVGDWGPGSVQLVEIPTNDEIHDNIVVFWAPQTPPTAGTAYRLRYRLHWQADEPFPAENLARVVATRIGRGGKPGQPRPKGVTKFVVEFAGKTLETLPKDAKPAARVTASRGEVSYVFVEAIPNVKRWRAQFDVAATGTDPVELRLFLASGDQALTETWLYQLEPRPIG
jgi:glucans biosynthesis protein